MRRRNEATERSRTSSARRAVTSVSRPRCFSARGARGPGAQASPAARAAGDGARAVLRLFGFERRAGRGPTGRTFFAEPLLGDFAGFALGFFVVLAAVFLLALASVGGFALGAVARLTQCAAARFLLGDFAFFGFAHAAVGKRVSARRDLFLREGAQHDA